MLKQRQIVELNKIDERKSVRVRQTENELNGNNLDVQTTTKTSVWLTQELDLLQTKCYTQSTTRRLHFKKYFRFHTEIYVQSHDWHIGLSITLFVSHSSQCKCNPVIGLADLKIWSRVHTAHSENRNFNRLQRIDFIWQICGQLSIVIRFSKSIYLSNRRRKYQQVPLHTRKR